MPFQKQRPDLILSPEAWATLEAVSRSRTAPARRVECAKILLGYAAGASVSALARTLRRQGLAAGGRSRPGRLGPAGSPGADPARSPGGARGGRLRPAPGMRRSRGTPDLAAPGPPCAGALRRRGPSQLGPRRARHRLQAAAGRPLAPRTRARTTGSGAIRTASPRGSRSCCSTSRCRSSARPAPRPARPRSRPGSPPPRGRASQPSPGSLPTWRRSPASTPRPGATTKTSGSAR